MTHDLAAAAANCNTGTWAQKWNCGWSQPVSPQTASAGYTFGHSLLPALVVLLVIILIARSARKRKKSRTAAPAGAGARR
jgi:hypothetical protein